MGDKSDWSGFLFLTIREVDEKIESNMKRNKEFESNDWLIKNIKDSLVRTSKYPKRKKDKKQLTVSGAIKEVGSFIVLILMVLVWLIIVLAFGDGFSPY